MTGFGTEFLRDMNERLEILKQQASELSGRDISQFASMNIIQIEQYIDAYKNGVDLLSNNN